MIETKIYIPKKAKYTYPLVVLFEPPVLSSFIQLCNEDGTVFQSGELKEKRASEISLFTYRPKKIIEVDGEPVQQTHLKIGDKILVKVQAFDSGRNKFEAEELVEVVE